MTALLAVPIVVAVTTARLVADRLRSLGRSGPATPGANSSGDIRGRARARILGGRL